MKKLLLSLVAIATIALTSFGQAPEAFKYQAVVRDPSGAIIANQAVGYELTILQGSPAGAAVYTETFTPTSNNYGLVNLEIGTGTTVDNFSAIDWANGPYYIQTAADFTGGTSYVVMGTSQLVSVPYALYAKTAQNVTNDQVNDADADPNNEIQILSFSNDTLYLSNGGQVYLGAYAVDLVNDADADPNNEIQAISFSNDTLYLSNGGQIYLGAYGIDNVVDADADPSNELQSWTTLPGIPGDFADNIDNVDDADNDPNNEIETWTTLGGIPAGFADDIDNVDDADNDPNNEIQALSLSNDTLYLSNGNNVYIGNVGGGSGNPPGFPNGFNNMLPIFGANSGCMAWGSEMQEDFVDAIVQADGGMIILTEQEVDYVLYRTNSLGEVIRKVGMRNAGKLNSFCQNPTNGNLYFTGSYNNDFRVSITDSMGIAIGHYGWSNLGEGKKIIYGSDNNLYALLQCAPPYGNGGIDVVVARINLSGTITNKFVYGTSSSETPGDLIQLSNGDLLVSFTSSTNNAVVTRLSIGFGIQWSKQLDTGSASSSRLFESSTGSLYYAYVGGAWNTLRISKLASDGSLIFGKDISFSGYTTISMPVTSLIEKTADTLIITGQFNNVIGGQAGYILYMDTLGNVPISHFGGSSEPYTVQSYDKAFIINSHLYVLGNTNIFGWGDWDVLGSKFDLGNSGCCTTPLAIGSSNNAVNSNYAGSTASFSHVTQGVTWQGGSPIIKVFSDCFQD